MRHLRAALVVSLSLLSAAISLALSPRPPLPLEQRVRQSGYIFMGDVTAVNYVNQAGQIITPEQAFTLLPYREVELVIRVGEVLYPRNLQPSGFAKLRVPNTSLGAIYPPETVEMQRKILSAWRREMGRRSIFLTRVLSPAGQESYLRPALGTYDNYYQESPNSRSKVRSILRAKVMRRSTRKPSKSAR